MCSRVCSDGEEAAEEEEEGGSNIGAADAGDRRGRFLEAVSLEKVDLKDVVAALLGDPARLIPLLTHVVGSGDTGLRPRGCSIEEQEDRIDPRRIA